MFSSCQKIGTKVSNRFNTNLCLMKILTVKMLKIKYKYHRNKLEGEKSMAQLFSKYGAMNSGKTIEILKVAHNYEEQNKPVVLMTSGIDTRDGFRRCFKPNRTET